MLSLLLPLSLLQGMRLLVQSSSHAVCRLLLCAYSCELLVLVLLLFRGTSSGDPFVSGGLFLLMGCTIQYPYGMSSIVLQISLESLENLAAA